MHIPSIDHALRELVLAGSALIPFIAILSTILTDSRWHTMLLAVRWGVFGIFAASLILVAAGPQPRLRRLGSHWLDILATICVLPLLPPEMALFGGARVAYWFVATPPGAWLTRLVVSERAVVSRRALRFVFTATVLLILGGGVAVSISDPHEFNDPWLGLWWAATTVTTVGYGDVVPDSVAGRIVGGVLMFGGIGLVSILTAALATALVAETVESDETQSQAQSRASHPDSAAVSESLRLVEQRLAALEQLLRNQSAVPSTAADGSRETDGPESPTDR